jgi:hypothetical protein
MSHLSNRLKFAEAPGNGELSCRWENFGVAQAARKMPTGRFCPEAKQTRAEEKPLYS